MRSIRVATALAGALWLGGCATVTRGTSEVMQITSAPSGAQASTSTGFNCTTPCTLTVNRKEEFVVKFDDAGYQPQEIAVKTQIASAGVAGFAGNVVAGGVVGMVADAATGATLEHVPNPVHADLVPIAATPSSAKPWRRPLAKAAPAAENASE
ncbi:MAG: translation initiation factor 2 [Hyphomicrobiales bacterium]|nr:translation initiation factor 2 [Hyphomicrobiales bacterium]MBV9051257.1 translation initiation factor 2 [Hyphomicrobiales bacterium]MBV9977318.1 translation initiation factor 2 [Hyphomicrobiales bacterium]